MRVKGITQDQLISILQKVNANHNSEIGAIGIRKQGNFLLFTLRLFARWTNKKKTGSDIFRRWTNDNWGKTKAGVRYNNAVCFHGHWQIYREIFVYNPDAVIVTAIARYGGLRDLENKAPYIGYRNAGSMMYPLHFEDACNCR